MPRPRPRPAHYDPIKFEESYEILLGPPADLAEIGFKDVVLGRRSGISFAELDRLSLGSLLWYSARTIAVQNQDQNREMRPVPSAGALHPLHLLVSEDPKTWLRYSPRRHALCHLSVQAEQAQGLWEEVRQVLDVGEGTVILLLAEMRLVSAYYDHPESLVFRDAGCLLGQLGLVAAALGLSYRILGPTGEPWASELIPSQGDSLAGAGLAVVGRKA